MALAQPDRLVWPVRRDQRESPVTQGRPARLDRKGPPELMAQRVLLVALDQLVQPVWQGPLAHKVLLVPLVQREALGRLVPPESKEQPQPSPDQPVQPDCRELRVKQAH